MARFDCLPGLNDSCWVTLGPLDNLDEVARQIEKLPWVSIENTTVSHNVYKETNNLINKWVIYCKLCKTTGRNSSLKSQACE